MGPFLGGCTDSNQLSKYSILEELSRLRGRLRRPLERYTLEIFLLLENIADFNKKLDFASHVFHSPVPPPSLHPTITAFPFLIRASVLPKSAHPITASDPSCFVPAPLSHSPLRPRFHSTSFRHLLSRTPPTLHRNMIPIMRFVILPPLSFTPSAPPRSHSDHAISPIAFPSFRPPQNNLGTKFASEAPWPPLAMPKI